MRLPSAIQVTGRSGGEKASLNDIANKLSNMAMRRLFKRSQTSISPADDKSLDMKMPPGFNWNFYKRAVANNVGQLIKQHLRMSILRRLFKRLPEPFVPNISGIYHNQYSPHNQNVPDVDKLREFYQALLERTTESSPNSRLLQAINGQVMDNEAMIRSQKTTLPGQIWWVFGRTTVIFDKYKNYQLYSHL